VWFTILGVVVIDEDLLMRLVRQSTRRGDAGFVLNVGDQPGMIEPPEEMARIHEPMRSMAHGHLIAECTAQGHFAPLNGIEHQQAQFAVEPVEIEHQVEGGTGLERFACLRAVLQGQGISRQPVITDMLQVMEPGGLIGNREAATLELGQLLRQGQRGLREPHRRPPKTKHPPWCACCSPCGGQERRGGYVAAEVAPFSALLQAESPSGRDSNPRGRGAATDHMSGQNPIIPLLATASALHRIGPKQGGEMRESCELKAEI